MAPGLAALTHPDATDELAACFARNEPLVVHGLGSSIAELTALPLVASLDALLQIWPDVVQAHLPDVRDESHAVSVSPQDARKLFANGMGLLFDDAGRYAPALVPWLDAIRSELGLSALTQQRCLVYATPTAKGTAWHFDQNVNFVLQVHGTKTWWLAPNAHVERPMTRHTVGQHVDAELQSYARLPMLGSEPANVREIVLEPGSLLFVPRGVWHATRATTDALSLNFTFTAPTWIDLLTAALRGRLALSREWRETAAPASAETFEALLRELAEDAAHWNAADILAVTEGSVGRP
jgi:50S ribosomal protein L16 3-hydroxylase